LQLSETQVGLLMGLPLAIFAIAAIPGSLLIARIGTTPAVIIGLTIAALAGGARGSAVDEWGGGRPLAPTCKRARAAKPDAERRLALSSRTVADRWAGAGRQE
jgi:hypothetical protein